MRNHKISKHKIFITWSFWQSAPIVGVFMDWPIQTLLYGSIVSFGFMLTLLAQPDESAGGK